MESGQEELLGVQPRLGRLMLSRFPVVRAAAPVEGTGQAEFQLNALLGRQADARRQMEPQTTVDRSGVEELLVSVERGMTSVFAIDEPGVPRADQGHPQAQIRDVPGGVRPDRGETGRGSLRLIRSRGRLTKDHPTPRHHKERQGRQPKSRAANPMHDCVPPFSVVRRAISTGQYMFVISPIRPSVTLGVHVRIVKS